jgi:hypothetical protein
VGPEEVGFAAGSMPKRFGLDAALEWGPGALGRLWVQRLTVLNYEPKLLKISPFSGS